MILTFTELRGARRARDLDLMWRRRVLNVLILVSLPCYLTVTFSKHIHAHFLCQTHSDDCDHQKYNQTRNFVMTSRVLLSHCSCAKIIYYRRGYNTDAPVRPKQLRTETLLDFYGTQNFRFLIDFDRFSLMSIDFN